MPTHPTVSFVGIVVAMFFLYSLWILCSFLYSWSILCLFLNALSTIAFYVYYKNNLFCLTSHFRSNVYNLFYQVTSSTTPKASDIYCNDHSAEFLQKLKTIFVVTSVTGTSVSVSSVTKVQLVNKMQLFSVCMSGIIYEEDTTNINSALKTTWSSNSKIWHTILNKLISATLNYTLSITINHNVWYTFNVVRAQNCIVKICFHKVNLTLN